MAGFSVITFLAQVPVYYDEYLALFTLGATGTAENYFPGDAVNILPGDHISWYIGVYNHMGSVQLVKVVFKLLNATMQGPDQLNNTPSTRAGFSEKTRLLVSNETWTIPLSWSILNATETRTPTALLANFTAIHSILFNGDVNSENVEVQATHGYNYRIVIELWVYDETAGSYSFVWSSNGVKRSAWNQVWFNMTRISLLP